MDGEGCAGAFCALTGDAAPVQLDASFHDDQPEASAGQLAGVASAMKGIEELLLVGRRNANAFVVHAENGVAIVAVEGEFDRGAGDRVLNGVRQ